MLRTTLAALALALPMTACSETAPEEPRAPPAAVVLAFDKESVTPLIVEGVRNFESGEAVEANDPVRIASISKLIMALATMRLVDEGKVDLDADISDYLGFKVRSPNFPDAKVTLAQLLSHRAGLRDKAGYIIPLGESLEAKLAEPEAWYADAPPGDAPFEYANLGSPVVATALEAATRERYDALLERLVFAPLGVEACVNWIGCSQDMVARAVALYRHTDEPARDYPGDLPPGCSIPVAEGVECTLEGYKPGTNASVFSPQGGVRIGMMDLAKIGQAFDEDRDFFSAAAKESFDRAWSTSFHPDQEFFCIYGLHLQIIDSPEELWANAEEAKPTTCKDGLFGDDRARIGHSGEAYGLQSGLWLDLSTGTGVAYFRTQAPPPAGGEDTGGFTQGEKDLIQRAQDALAAKLAKQKAE
ncbi:MAG: serine hydrolase domain-containing protein [Pseudomonadota bacterium]